MSAITPHYKTIKDLLQGRSFSIDEYQREYKWEKKNVEELLSDLLGKFGASYRPGDETKAVADYDEYFLGSIIVSNRGNKSYLVDGQQRVTSLTLLLIYLHREANKAGLPIATTLAPLIFSDNLGQPSFNLDIPERRAVIEALFDGKPFTPDGKDESVRTMWERYGDIEQSGLTQEVGEGLQHFGYWLLWRVGLIEIATTNDNHAYSIFETMNDRGKPLSPVDMLKAYLLAPVSDAEHRRFANDRWKHEVLSLLTLGDDQEKDRDASCIKAWLRAQHAETTRDRKAGAIDRDWELIGSEFNRWVRDNSARIGVGSAQANLAWINDHFPFFAKAYALVLSGSKTYTTGLEAVFSNAHNEFTWQSTVLLAPLDPSDSDATVRAKIAVTATYLDIWLMRRTVNYIRVGYSSVSYAMWLLAKDIRRKPLAELVAILEDKLTIDDVTFQGSAARDRKGIDDLALNQFSRRYIYHLLARMVAFTEVGAGRADPFSDLVDRDRKNPYDIEHIWANDRQLHDDVFDSDQEFVNLRNGVAALLLLPADVNRSLQDKPYAEKLGKYASHHFYTASLADGAYANQPQFDAFRAQFQLPFRPHASFTKTDLAVRRELVARLVEVIWSPSRIAATLPATTSGAAAAVD